MEIIIWLSILRKMSASTLIMEWLQHQYVHYDSLSADEQAIRQEFQAAQPETYRRILIQQAYYHEQITQCRKERDLVVLFIHKQKLDEQIYLRGQRQEEVVPDLAVREWANTFTDGTVADKILAKVPAVYRSKTFDTGLQGLFLRVPTDAQHLQRLLERLLKKLRPLRDSGLEGFLLVFDVIEALIFYCETKLSISWHKFTCVMYL